MLSVLGLLILTPLIYWQAYVATVLWGWFITPVYGVQSPSIYTIGGVLFLWSLIRDTPPRAKSDDKWGDFLWAVSSAIVVPALLLGIAWVWKYLQWGM